MSALSFAVKCNHFSQYFHDSIYSCDSATVRGAPLLWQQNLNQCISRPSITGQVLSLRIQAIGAAGLPKLMSDWCDAVKGTASANVVMMYIILRGHTR